MQLTPRYDGPSLLRIELPLGDPAVPMLRQRRRLATLLAELGAEQWAAASRCDGWSVQDVIVHLVSTNQFWAASIGAALGGEPTRILTAFDPVSTPAALVEAAGSLSTADVLDRYVATNEQLAAAVAGLDDDGWAAVGESPLGHVPLQEVALHALWDAWIHERDVMLPLGLAQVEEPDEIAGCLAYAAALGPSFAAAGNLGRTGAIAVEATAPDVRLVVEVGDAVSVHGGDAPPGALRLGGSAVDLVEGLSLRAPLPCPVPDDQRWLLSGLAEVFDQAS